MSHRVTLELPLDLAEQAREVAAHSHRRLEEVLVEWLGRGASDQPLELLPDPRVLALCDLVMDPAQQAELSDLLARNREGSLDNRERERLEALMVIYRRGLVRKAQALKVAVDRGLRPALT